MLFSKCASLSEFTDCHLIINDTCIYPSEETQFIGFTLDYRLKWTAHISNKVLETRKLNADRNAVKSAKMSLETQFSKLADFVRADVHA